ncbi:MAG TPA: extracellular solute-binding protein [Chloroflexota bacterium]
MQHSFRRAWRATVIVACALVAAACGASAPARTAAPPASAPAPEGKAATAVAPQATASAAPLPAAVQQEWGRVVAAAGQEGKVVVAVPPGPQYEPAIRQAFTKAFPNVQIEMVNIIGGQFRQRVEKERAADQYDWDVCICGAGADTYRLIAAGVFDPIKDDLILPDVLDDSKWMGGFDGRFSDDAKKYSFDFGLQSSAGAYVNRDAVRESDLASFDDLWKPQFRGKITWQDPRGPGSGVNAATVILHVYGEDKLRELWTTQQVQLSTDDRQMAEWVMRGTRPIGIGMVYNRGLLLLKQEGLASNVKTIPYPVPVAVAGAHSVLAVNRPPHPNARKLFLNWLLTPEGQVTISTAIQSNSARLDVPIFDPESEVPKGVETINTQAEVFVGPRSRAGDLAREVFK